MVFWVLTRFTIKFLGYWKVALLGWQAKRGHDELDHLSISTSLENLKWQKMVVIDLVADTGNTDRACANQYDHMWIDRWV